MLVGKPKKLTTKRKAPSTRLVELSLDAVLQFEDPGLDYESGGLMLACEEKPLI